MLILVIIILVGAFLWRNVKMVPQAHAYVIESLGKFKCVWSAGLHLKIPIIENISRKVSLKERVLDFPPQPVITKDNVTMQIDSVVFCKVFDPELFTYGAENPIVGLQNLAATTLRNIIGEMELDQTLTGRDEINKRMEVVLDMATDPWGIKVTRVEIKNIEPPASIQAVMETQMRAERERRQTVLEAKAHQEAVVSRAEGDKQAKILAAEAERDAQIALAEGRARSIKMVYEAEADGLRKLSAAGINESVLKLKGIEALKDVADGRATKIIVPSDISSAVASLGVAGEVLGIGDHTAIDKTPKVEQSLRNDPCITERTSAGGREAAFTTAMIDSQLRKKAEDGID
ncbi:MAG TPA: peptidase [Lachnospiraceae bacterium]|nr:peptidase [Lachnospiraceae bacterium]